MHFARVFGRCRGSSGGDQSAGGGSVLRHDPMALSEIADLSRWADIGWNLVAVPVTARRRCVGCARGLFSPPRSERLR